MKISEKDKLLIMELLKDCRTGPSELGRRCGMSRQTAFNRVKHLQKSGAVDGFEAIPGYSKLGLDFRAYILVTAEPGKRERDSIARFLRGREQISQIHYLFGRFDFFLEVIVRDREDLARLLSEIHDLRGVNRTETFIVYETLKYDPNGPARHMLKSDRPGIPAHSGNSAQTATSG